MAAIAYLVRNGVAAPGVAPAAKRFLLSAPRGAYTTARTVDQRSVFELDRHLERLAETSRLMLDGGATAENACAGVDPPLRELLCDASRLRPFVLSSARAALGGFARRYPELESERKLTLLVAWADGELDVFAHVAELPPRPSPPVEVRVLGAPRSNAKAKDSEWVRSRQALEDAKPAHVNELLLCDASGALPEGTQTNFFAVRGGVVTTAPDDGSILAGTVRGIVLDVCAAAGIPVELSAPNVRDAADWEEAFIASTSRLVLPIDALQVVEGAEGLRELRREFAAHPVGDRLLELVREELRSRSSEVLIAEGGARV